MICLLENPKGQYISYLRDKEENDENGDDEDMDDGDTDDMNKRSWKKFIVQK